MRLKMKRIIIVLIFAAVMPFFQGCQLFDRQPAQIDVYVCGLDVGESFLLWSDSPSVKVLDGGNISSYAVTANPVSPVEDQAYSSAPLNGGMRWSSSSSAEFLALQGIDANTAELSQGHIVPPAIPSRQRWDYGFQAIPKMAGPSIAERGIPVTLRFSQVVTRLVFVLPQLADGITIVSAAIITRREAVSGAYVINAATGSVQELKYTGDNGRIDFDLEGLEPFEDGTLRLAAWVIPHKYRDFHFSVSLSDGLTSYSYMTSITEEPYGSIIEPFNNTTIFVPLPEKVYRQID